MASFLLPILALVSAVPSPSLGLQAANCTVTSYIDVKSATSQCQSLVLKDITVPAKQTLRIDLLPGATLTFQGTITWGYAEWEGPLIVITGNRVNVMGKGAVLDGQGAKWWDKNGDEGKAKPFLLMITTTGGSLLQYINIKNCPNQCVGILKSSDTTLDHFNIDISAGNSGGAANTDGFDIYDSNHITINNSIVINQDDCVAINQGSNMICHNLTCIGGHGLSLSVGQSSSSGTPNTLRNVTFSDCTVKNSVNGIHIKTHSDAGTGSITDITYSRITLFGILHYGINVEEDYEKGSPTLNPKGNIPIKQLTINGVTGSMTSPESMAVYILCGSGGCSNWTWSGVSISNAAKANVCNFAPSGYKC